MGPWARPARAASLTVMVVGDSLSAEYGMPRGTGWVALLGQRLKKAGLAATVINASISGDTTSGGRSRLPALLKQHQPTHLIVELGGNDALRGIPMAVSDANLRWMAQAGREAGAKVMVTGLEMPPNYGARYTQDFSAMFAKVAQAEGATLVPSLLAGVSDDPEPLRWFQADRIHPVEAAQPMILENVWRVLQPAWLKATAGNAAANGPSGPSSNSPAKNPAKDSPAESAGARR
ncbi:MAG TPA: arylesterase [Burkholderiaceae bacterium]|nr:arylesterase [Burkholderiaceae bacterium]